MLRYWLHQPRLLYRPPGRPSQHLNPFATTPQHRNFTAPGSPFQRAPVLERSRFLSSQPSPFVIGSPRYLGVQASSRFMASSTTTYQGGSLDIVQMYLKARRNDGSLDERYNMLSAWLKDRPWSEVLEDPVQIMAST